MTFNNMLDPIGWVILLAVPPLIVLLYFLKLRRQPVVVPSTLLWQRAIEDFHVNSFWQRLRRNLLLILQLSLVLLLILACLGPSLFDYQLPGKRFIFLIDNSASMQATDTGQTRFELAKERIAQKIDQMKSGDQAMIISFSNEASIVQGYTGHKSELKDKLDNVKTTNRTSDLREALLAASGLANPSRVSEAGTIDVQVADPQPATLYIFSDGGIESVEDFALGHLTPKFISIGNKRAFDNVGITMFSVEQNSQRLDQIQAFARIENFGSKKIETVAELFLNDRSRDFERVTIAAGESQGVEFDLSGLSDEQLEQAQLRLQLDRSDDFDLDNVAYAVLNAARPARVLVVSEQNDVLKFALNTDEARKIAEVEFIEPANMDTDQYKTRSKTGQFDLVIYDHCAPQEMPASNTWFIGTLPPGGEWSAKPSEKPPIVIDSDQTHPLMQSISLQNILVVEALLLQGPAGSQPLIESDAGTLLAIGPRQGFEDLVLGIPFFTTETDGSTVGNTNWLRLTSFPVFVHNVLTYLGGGRRMLTTPNVQPGNPVTLQPAGPVESLKVVKPSGDSDPSLQKRRGRFRYSGTGQIGIYNVIERDADKVSQRFAVNLFSRRESNIRPGDLSIGYQDIEPISNAQHARWKVWKWLVIAGFVLLLVEWHVYHRRVFFKSLFRQRRGGLSG